MFGTPHGQIMIPGSFELGEALEFGSRILELLLGADMSNAAVAIRVVDDVAGAPIAPVTAAGIPV
jgi:hypothetical protein